MDQQDTIYFDGKFEKIHERITNERKETDKKLEKTHLMIGDTNQSISDLDRVMVEKIRDAGKTHEDTHHPQGVCKDTTAHITKDHDWAKFWKMVGGIVGIVMAVGGVILWALRQFIHEAIQNGAPAP